MRHCAALFISIPALLFAGSILTANSLTVQLTGVGASDGSYFVLPYELSIDGVETSAICYDFHDEISMNQTWTATELTLQEAMTEGQFSSLSNALAGYEQVAWLSSLQFTETLTTADQIDLQHAIWNVFSPGAYTLPDDSFLDSVQANEAGGMAALNYNSYQFLEAISGNGILAQSFVLYTPAGNNNGNPGSAPEPGSTALLMIGLALIGISGVSRLRNRR